VFGWLLNRDSGISLSAARCDEWEGKTALEVRGLSSREKFHKQ